MWQVNNGMAGPFYHGTSTVFEASIRQHGLGGVDPIESLGVLTAFRSMVSLADEHLSKSKDWPGKRQFYDDIVGQRRMWRHGATHLTPFRLRAKLHCRSELLGFADGLYRDLIRRRIKDPRLHAISDSPLGALFRTKGKPLLITIPKVAVTSLKSENDRPLEEVLAEVSDLAASFGVDVLSGDVLSSPAGGVILMAPVAAGELVIEAA